MSGDFWLILYVNSPNDARGWDLKYHDSSLCTSSNRWYIGSQAGWTTTAQTGCPDAHIHVARRALTHLDGVTATVTAEYEGGDSASLTDTFYFATLPNLAPNPTSFISPVAHGVYDGGGTETLTVSWNPATDPNDGDILNYTITLLTSTGAEILPALATATGATSFDWSISAVANGTYGLKGEVCDNNASPLCTEFLLDGTFTIEKVATVFSLNSITIASDNANTALAKAGDTVTLSFSATGDISATADVTMYSGGQEITNPVTLANDGNDWTATYVVSSTDTDGIIDFEITADNLDLLYAETTDDSYITVDVTAAAPTASPAAGTYSAPQTVTLSAEDSSSIRFTIDGSDPTCTTGNVYSAPLSAATYTLLKAVACDEAGNVSDVATFAFTITGTAAATTEESGVSGGRRGSSIATQNRYSPEGTVQSLHNAPIAPSATQHSFRDVSAAHPQAEAIYAIVNKSGINGITTELFRPKQTITRAQAVQIVLALLGITPDPTMYKDCFPDAKTATICYAKDAGWVSGFLGGEYEGFFKPDLPLAREQAAAILLRTLQPDILGPKGQQEESWYARYISAARRSGVLREILRRRVTRGSFVESAYRLHGASQE
ncbi:MAG: chitobiase/beta-hexosaminidase C-terminal domain-containing protein [Candidatus Peribacteraceae bacterium]|nr:chitobiase/beta-hexosaminidase C-terminal domain-containing protein [Candidatus Peribacteraceae bacterium]